MPPKLRKRKRPNSSDDSSDNSAVARSKHFDLRALASYDADDTYGTWKGGVSSSAVVVASAELPVPEPAVEAPQVEQQHVDLPEPEPAIDTALPLPGASSSTRVGTATTSANWNALSSSEEEAEAAVMQEQTVEAAAPSNLEVRSDLPDTLPDSESVKVPVQKRLEKGNDFEGSHCCVKSSASWFYGFKRQFG